MFEEINNFILDTLFPIKCLDCKKEGEWLCQECFEKIELLPFQVCPLCEKNITEKGVVCYGCKEKLQEQNKPLPIDSLVVATRYKSANVAHLVHLYKYSFITGLSEPLGKILTRSFLENNLPLPDYIIPVPLHPRRLRSRGFNQSELLSRYISENLSPSLPIPVLSGLVKRERYTSPQMKIKNYLERQKNIQNAFQIHPADSEVIINKKILLIDDIATTGSTLLECGRILKQNSAKEVWAAVIARQEMGEKSKG